MPGNHPIDLPGLANFPPEEFVLGMSTFDELDRGDTVLYAPAVRGIFIINKDKTGETDMQPLALNVARDAIRIARADGAELDIAYDRDEAEELHNARLIAADRAESGLPARAGQRAILHRPISELVLQRINREGAYRIEGGASVVGDVEGVDLFAYKINYYAGLRQKRADGSE